MQFVLYLELSCLVKKEVKEAIRHTGTLSLEVFKQEGFALVGKPPFKALSLHFLIIWGGKHCIYMEGCIHLSTSKLGCSYSEAGSYGLYFVFEERTGLQEQLLGLVGL